LSGKTPTKKSDQPETKGKADTPTVDPDKVKRARFISIRKTEHTGKRREAATMYCAGVRSASVLSRYFGVSRNTIYEWKDKDSWVDLARQVDSEVEAGASSSLATFKAKQVEELLKDIDLIDSKKHDVPPKSLEGLMKAKMEIVDRLLLLRGEATSRNEQVTVVFGGVQHTVRTEERGPVPMRPGEIGRAPQSEASVDIENTQESEGGRPAREGGKGDSIENHRGNVESEVKDGSRGESGAGGAAGPGPSAGEKPGGAGGSAGEGERTDKADSAGGAGRDQEAGGDAGESKPREGDELRTPDGRLRVISGAQGTKKKEVVKGSWRDRKVEGKR
jgi:hypothetical protein